MLRYVAMALVALGLTTGCQPEKMSSCELGEKGCSCTTGKLCAPGLVCTKTGKCVTSCEPGSLECSCASDQSCGTTEDGKPLVCIADTCRVPDCQPGSLGCYCQHFGLCDPETVCDNGWCVHNTGQTLVPPQTPKCYTPCRGGTVTNNAGDTVHCSSKGYIEGCIGDTACFEGSCQLPQTATWSSGVEPGCSSGSQCPTHQNCIAGKCYSDCEEDSDCNTPRKCHNHACRIPCSTTDEPSTCPEDTYCATQNMLTGYCLPIADAQDIEPAPTSQCPQGQSPVQDRVLVFTPQDGQRHLLLTNCSQDTRTFTLSKVEHALHRDGVLETERTAPLDWLTMGLLGETPTTVSSVMVHLAPAESATLLLDNTGYTSDPSVLRWDGSLQVAAPGLPATEVRLTYAESPAGQWAGKVYYMANFGTGHLQQWRAALAQGESQADAQISQVGNALIRRWWGFRSGRIPYGELMAMLTSTISESWRWPVSQNFCANSNAACYPSDNLQGFSIYSDDLEASPVPTGISELEMAMNLQAEAGDATTWSGRIVSSQALQLPGNPVVQLQFAGDPNHCFRDPRQAEGSCLTVITDMHTQSVLGPRFRAKGDSCGEERLQRLSIPWLIPGFVQGTTVDGYGRRWFHECRDSHIPFGADDTNLDINVSLAGANPIANGSTIRSNLTLIDGVLVDGEEILILFEQQLPSLFPSLGGSAKAYGLMQLKSTSTSLSEEDYLATIPPGDPAPVPPPETICRADLVQKLFPDSWLYRQYQSGLASGSLIPGRVANLAQGMLEGTPRDSEPDIINSARQSAHYLCHMDGRIDGGVGHKYPCPAGSKVTYFVADNDDWRDQLVSDDGMTSYLPCSAESGRCRRDEPCAADHIVVECDNVPEGCTTSHQQVECQEVCIENGGCRVNTLCEHKGNCEPLVQDWIANPPDWFRPNPEWRCGDPNELNCDYNRRDLREGKLFYQEAPEAPAFVPLAQAVDEAFRYKTRFASRLTGATVGFAPQICAGNAIPYCYDPEAIEEIEGRVDCLTHLYATYYDVMDDGTKDRISRYLRRNFSYEETVDPLRSTPVTYHGFEHMNAELLVMLGDEAYTSAFASRFDLAEQMVASFEGSAFEHDGIDLAGGAGYEMHSLYLATQYYQHALDRLFGMTDVLGVTLDPGFVGAPLVDDQSAISWLKKLIRASSQKARAFAEIAERYHVFNRPGPARRVIEKAYATGYLESIYISELMAQVLLQTSEEKRAQVEREIELAQLTYKMALVEMKNVHTSLNNDVSYFGFPQTYIPFPALDPADPNAFERVMDRAHDKAEVAADKEDQALSDQREFNTDHAAFQSELANIGMEYDSELGEICGTFRVQTGDGEVVYPATSEFAHLGAQRMQILGDPCGLVGNGAIHEAMAELEMAKLAMELWKVQRSNFLQTAVDEEQRIDEQCDRIDSFKAFVMEKNDKIHTWSSVSADFALGANLVDRAYESSDKVLDTFACVVGLSTDCPTKAGMIPIKTALAAGYLASTSALEVNMAQTESKILDLEQAVVHAEMDQECQEIEIDYKFVFRDMMRQMAELELEGLQLIYETNLVLAQINGLRNQAISTMANKQEQTRLTIDVEAARNDPNVRIYRNDAIINADRTFQSALREAYRATVVYEYYTSSSFAKKQQLYLTRMVAHGDYSLESYLDDLEEAFYTFEEDYGNPDLRVYPVSVAHDVFQISRMDNGQALTPAQLQAAFVERLEQAPRNAGGDYLIDFLTSLETVSPLTHNHRIRFIEAEFIGENLGDDLGRVYVQQRGDGVGFVRGGDGVRHAYSFPQRTAVVDATFNGERPLSDALGLYEGSTWDYYRNERLRDRPLQHSGWRLIFSPYDEVVNRDIDISGLADIRIYLWYHDFTEM